MYAEPFIEVDGMHVFDMSLLLSKAYDSWEAWHDDAVVLKAARASQQDVNRINTTVKITKTLPCLTNLESKLDVTMSEDFGLELDQHLKVIGSAIDDLLQEGMIQDGTVGDKEETENDSLGHQEAKERRSMYE